MIEVLVSATFVFVLDQAVKRAAKARFAGEGLRLGRVVTLRHVATRRRHFEITVVRTAFVAVWLAATASTLILASDDYFASALSLIALGAGVGGAASNLLDIIGARAVHDYIDLGWWPVFNIADVAILAGLSIAFLAR